jgi:DNA-binding transcriptional LysR family regulator
MRQLLAVRRHGSFAKAAEALGMSQPSLSAAIARMEDQLGVSLFERSPQGSTLTPIGELIAERAGKVVGEAEQIVRDAAMVAGGEAGVLRLGVGSALRHGFLPRFVGALTDSQPLLSVIFEVSDRDRLIPRLRAREIDVAICAVADEVADESLVVTQVLTAQAVAAVRPDHPLAGEARVPLHRLVEFPAAGTTLRQFTNRDVLAPTSDEPALMKYQSNDYEPLIALALQGRAILMGPDFVMWPYLQDGRLRLIDLDWEFKVSFAVITTRASATMPMVSRAIRHAVAVGAAMQAEGAAASPG